MTQVFNNEGQSVPVTVIEAGPCTVTQVKTQKNDGYEAIQVGYGIRKNKHSNKALNGNFKKADTVILCPIYTAGEKINLGFSYDNFAKEIIKNSKVKLFMVKNNFQLAKFLKQNMYGIKIVVGMGAGSISNWIKELPDLMK